MAMMTFEQKLGLINQLIFRARVHYDIWWVYEGKNTRQKFLETMNYYSEFFRFDSHANFVSLLMHLSQIYETRHDTLNFGTIIKDAINKGINDEVVARSNMAFQEANLLWRKVAIIRGNLFAHRAVKLSYEDVFKKASITPGNLGELTLYGLSIVNPFLVALGKEQREFNSLVTDDTVHLLETLKDAS